MRMYMFRNSFRAVPRCFEAGTGVVVDVVDVVSMQRVAVAAVVSVGVG